MTTKGDAMKKVIMYLVILVSAVMAGRAAEAAIIVGRISHIEGEIYRYMDVDNSWVATQLQSPAGTEDVLATGKNSRAEIIFPNNLLLRLDEDAEIEILELDDDLGVFQLQAGLARLYNRSVSGRLVIETVRGTANVAPGSVIDVRADGSTVVVSAVLGGATFQSLRNGVEGMEVISGSTSLEFRAEAIVAGKGPLNWNWDRWCADREGVWARNSLVRSEYLPESMQDYAYEMEPYGNWNRVYYRGYYYWAWKPRLVAAGWSPYTNGSWYDWQGSPVWIDNNPWGWVTHHHGNWIQLQGSWMWTPYVHVSHVPGVTVVGLNITFGKTYRSSWHPGRVRWMTHNDYIGWFPLAPWETYYGYRKWNSGTVLVQGGSGFSLGINLLQHRHIAAAVVIPRQHLYKKGPVAINSYNTVRIRNSNKTVIIKDYKPMLTAEKERVRMKISGKSGQTKNTYRRNVSGQPAGKGNSARDTARYETPVKRNDRVGQIQRAARQERQEQNAGQGFSSQIPAPKRSVVIERQREKTGAREVQQKAVKPAQRVRALHAAKQGKAGAGIGSPAHVAAPRKQETREAKEQAKPRVFRQAEVKSRGSVVVQEKATAGRAKEKGARKQSQKETSGPQRQVARKAAPGKKANGIASRKTAAPEEQQETKSARQRLRTENAPGEKNTTRERNADNRKLGRQWTSASLAKGSVR